MAENYLHDVMVASNVHKFTIKCFLNANTSSPVYTCVRTKEAVSNTRH